MSLRKENLVNNEIYHIFNRGVDKRIIFKDDKDKIRFIHDLFEFNDKKPSIKYSEVRLPNIKKGANKENLIEIFAYCIMDNHFHLMVRQKTQGGITKFMRKLGTGYTNYFNKKYDRVGSLFQGKFKSINIKKNNHLLYLPIYIHLNPLDIKFKNWKQSKKIKYGDAINFLDSYRWSSYLDYTGKKNFPSIIKKDFLLYRLGNEKKQKEELNNWIKSFDEFKIKDILFD